MRGRISELRQTIRDRVQATNATRFKQGSATPTWKETRRPYKILDDSHARKHLLFTIDVSSVRTGLGGRGNLSDGYLVEAEVKVQFLYRIRASDHDDEDSAADAAEAVAGSILTPGAWDHIYNISANEIFSSDLTPDGESLLVDQRYVVRFTIPFPVDV